MRKILFIIPFFLWTCGGGGGSTEPEPPQLPTVQNINLEGVEDTPITFTFLGTDPQNLSLTYSISTEPENGNVTINNSVGTYTPNANYNGSDTFYYLASNSGVNSNIGTVAINIAAVDDQPNSMDVNVTTDEDNSVSITLQAEEYDGDNIEFNITGNPSNGTVTLTGTNATYTPNQDWFGTDTFNFEAVDSSSRSIINVATATIRVNPINDAPTAVDVSKTMDQDEGTIEVETNYNDIDGDTDLTFTLVDAPSNGTATVGSPGTPGTYTPNANFYGTDTFTYTVSDAEFTSDPATVTITVIAGSFVTTYGSDSNHETPSSITATSDGGVVVVGYRYSTDWLVVKFDQGGSAEWEYTISSDEGPSQVIETLDGGIVIAGQLNGKTIIKLDSSGNEVFSSSNLPGSGILLLKEDSSGNIYTSGYESVNGTNSGSLTKLDSNGNLIWNKTYRKYNSNAEYVEAFVIHSDQSITAVGFGANAFNNEWIFNVDSSGNSSNMTFIDLDDGYPKNAELLSNGNIKIIVDNDQIVEVSSDFSIVSSINLSSPDAGGSIFKLKPTSDGGFIGAGKLNDSSTSSVDDGYFIKYNSSGTPEITKNVSTSLRDWFNDVDIISTGGYYFAGWSKGDDDDWDFYLVKVDDQGNRIF